MVTVEFAQLKTALKTKTEPVYLLYGSDIFLLYKSIDLIKASMPGAEVCTFDDETAPDSVAAALRTTSFFSAKRVVVYKIGEKTPAAALNQYIKSPEVGSVLILMGLADKNVYNIKGACEVNCNPMSAEILVKLIANQIAPKTITAAAAKFLVEATGGNYSIINNELNKIIAYFDAVPALDMPHVSEFVTKTADYQIYELGTSILLGRTAEAGAILSHLLASDIAEYAVFGGLTSQFRRAWYSTATAADQTSVAKFLGCSPFAVSYARRDFRGRGSAVKAKYKSALDLEYQIKSGKVSIANALFLLITS